MEPFSIGLLSILLLLILVIAGFHIGVVMGAMSFMGLWLITGNPQIALSLLGTTFYMAIKDYVFSVVPLFILMGAFLTQSDLCDDLFKTVHIVARKVHGCLIYATVIGNAIFAAVTGSSIASAAAFSKISLDPMLRLGYDKRLSLGSITGSSVLGMLIPPSNLLIIYGILTQVSIGKLFIAGIVPGAVLTMVYCIGIYFLLKFRPHLVQPNTAIEDIPWGKRIPILLKSLPIFILIILVLGGIYGGFFTPTEAGAVGAFGALIAALATRRLTLPKFWRALQDTGFTTGIIMFLLINAQMYSRMLTLSGVINWFDEFFAGLPLPPLGILIIFLVIILLMGTMIDSASILLLTMPVMFPISTKLGFDPVWFGIVVAVAVEMGLLTPPFGVSIYTVKAAMGDRATLEEIFSGTTPFLIMMAFFLVILIAFPHLSTWLVRYM